MKWKLALAFVCLLLSAGSAGAAAKVSPAPRKVIMRFGRAGNLSYDLKAGTADVSVNSARIITGMFASVRNQGKLVTSKDYTDITYNKKLVSTTFGKGEKHTFILKGKDLPQMQQVFFTYPGKAYFLTELVLSGRDLKSNYMAPVVCGSADIQSEGDNRTLFVPFDNDAFVKYNSKSMSDFVTNTSAELGAIYDNASRKGLILGSVEHMVWKTGVKSAGKGRKLEELTVWGGYSEDGVTRDKIEHGPLSGAQLKSPLVFVGYFDDWRLGLEEFGRANRLAEPPYVFDWTKPTPVGWNSWGVIQEKINYDKAIAVTNFFADSIPSFRNENTAFIDLDSFWDNMTPGGTRGDFSKLKEFAAYCRERGLEPGVYWAPFTDWGFKGGAERTAEGSSYKFSEMWTKVGEGYHDFDGARALDPTHPGTHARMAYVIKKLRECGFKMIKIDFLGHAAAESDHFYDQSVSTGMQAYRKGMEYLVDLLGDEMLIYAAISPSLATGRYAHMRRIACDAWKSIQDTKYTLNSLNYGWWQTYLYDYIDADHVVFGDASEGENRARLASAVITGTLITGDDFSVDGPWTEQAKQLLQNAGLLKIVKNGIAFRPVEGNTDENASEIFSLQIGKDFYLAVFNYDAKPRDYTIDLRRTGLQKSGSLVITELFTNKTFKQAAGAMHAAVGGKDAVIYKIGINGNR